MIFLERIRKLENRKKKIILWLIVILSAIILTTVFFQNARKRFQSFKKEDFYQQLKVPSFEKGMELLDFGEIGEKLKKQFEEK